MQFHRVTIEDKPYVDGFVRAENSRSADFNFGNIYLWIRPTVSSSPMWTGGC